MPSLSDHDRRAFLRLAREAVTQAVSVGQLPEQIPSHGVFAEKCGVFVTLHVRERLRGCIGVVEPDYPLGESIVRCAVMRLQRRRMTEASTSQIRAAHAASLTMPSVSPSRYARHAS